MYDSLQIENKLVAGVPCLLLSEKNKEAKGNLFLYHGWSSKKENYRFIGSTIALAGYRVVVPDSLYHGDRGELDYSSDQVMEELFWKVAIQSVEEYDAIRNSLEKDGWLNPENSSVMGSSMGGIISAGIFAKDPSLTTMVVMNGACAWQDMDIRVQKKRGIDRSVGTDPATMEAYDPERYLEIMYPRPFLVSHGEADISVPIEGQDYFVEKAKRFYGEYADRIRYTRIANLNHHKTTGMLEESINWLNYCLEKDF